MAACGIYLAADEQRGQQERGHEDPEALVSAFKGIKGVLEANASDHEISIVTPSAADVMAPVVTKANERGIKIHSIDIREPNLEAVFLHLTGRALRD